MMIKKNNVMARTRDAYLHFTPQILKERIDRALTESRDLNGGMAVLAMITFRDLAFEVPRDFLSKIVDAI